MTPISAPMTPISAPMTPISAPMTPNMTPRSGGLPAISSTLNNLDNWGQSANIICQYLGNTKLVPSSSFQIIGIPGLKHDVLSQFLLQLITTLSRLSFITMLCNGCCKLFLQNYPLIRSLDLLQRRVEQDVTEQASSYAGQDEASPR